MPSLEFVQACIGSPKKIDKKNHIMFGFPFYSEIVPNQIPELSKYVKNFNVYKDLYNSNGSREALLSRHSKNYILEIDRDSNDSFYNLMLDFLEIPETSQFRCFVHNMWREDYNNYQIPAYYFCFDDIPSKYKGIATATSSSFDNFEKRFFKDRILTYQNISYQSGRADYYRLSLYTTQYGDWTCSEFDVRSHYKQAENCCYMANPIGVNYNITNYADPEDEFSYNINFGDEYEVISLIYYVNFNSFTLEENCCLAQCFGITN